ncbi:hypothetical protein E2I21_11315 [Alcaligenaceae bacterium SAGV5]|nr:hypothetical protein [Alcaligenaceae bacterium SAGV5]
MDHFGYHGRGRVDGQGLCRDQDGFGHHGQRFGLGGRRGAILVIGRVVVLQAIFAQGGTGLALTAAAAAAAAAALAFRFAVGGVGSGEQLFFLVVLRLGDHRHRRDDGGFGSSDGRYDLASHDRGRGDGRTGGFIGRQVLAAPAAASAAVAVAGFARLLLGIVGNGRGGGTQFFLLGRAGTVVPASVASLSARVAGFLAGLLAFRAFAVIGARFAVVPAATVALGAAAAVAMGVPVFARFLLARAGGRLRRLGRAALEPAEQARQQGREAARGCGGGFGLGARAVRGGRGRGGDRRSSP